MPGHYTSLTASLAIVHQTELGMRICVSTLGVGREGRKKIFHFAFAFLSAPGDPGSGKECIFKAYGELMQVENFL